MSKEIAFTMLFLVAIANLGVIVYMISKKSKESTYNVSAPIEKLSIRKQGIYEKYVKRVLDIMCAILTIVCFGWLYIAVAIMVKVKLGSPILFKQKRPGLYDEKTGKETVFTMYKFRTMTDARDAKGNLLSDEERLTKFGAWLRASSLDELPEVFNILNGTMSVIGPRPQLVRDMVFMSKEQRLRHTARPGLSGLAQVNGRNAITWDEKLRWDLKYVEHVGLREDLKIIIKTITKAFIKHEGITEEDMATAEDFGDYLLKSEKVSREEYEDKQKMAIGILENKRDEIDDKKSVNVLLNHTPFSVAMSLYKNDDPLFFEQALLSIIKYQTIVPDEIILVVDGPITEDLDLIVDKYEKLYQTLKVIRLEKNEGLGNALRVAIENSSYELIARMDSDDISVANRFEQQLSLFMLYPEVDIIGGDINEFVGKEDNVVARRSVPTTNKEIREYMKTRCAMNHVSVMYKKSAVQAVGGYQDWFWNEDYYLWIRMWLSGAVFANSGTVLVNVRVGEEMYRRRGGKRYFESEKQLQKYMLKHEMIGRGTYLMNVTKRWIVQMLLPNKVRGWVLRTFARE